MLPESLANQLFKSGVIAVLIIDDVDDAIPLAYALLDGGINIMELTLRTPAAIESLIQVRKNVSEMTAGIGTVLTCDQVKQIKNADAIFGVAPGLNPNVVKAAKESNLPFAPGIMTPSDIESAVELGCNVLKFFPAEPAGGLNFLKSLAAPYNHLGLKYVPLGGLNQENAGDWLENPLILAIGGSWIAKRDMIQKKEWDKISENARLVTDLVAKVRG
jgi:2-dehydro-3-deoxyphosphogluconate aldolase/(4S)-4-hydroxy-2-oxoglutarate aldolase